MLWGAPRRAEVRLQAFRLQMQGKQAAYHKAPDSED